MKGNNAKKLLTLVVGKWVPCGKINRKLKKKKIKNSLFEFERDFIDLEDIQLKDREIKIKVEIEELFL